MTESNLYERKIVAIVSSAAVHPDKLRGYIKPDWLLRVSNMDPSYGYIADYWGDRLDKKDQAETIFHGLDKLLVFWAKENVRVISLVSKANQLNVEVEIVYLNHGPEGTPAPKKQTWEEWQEDQEARFEALVVAFERGEG